MSQSYYLSLPAQPGPGDLIAFRDAAITYAAARRQGCVPTVDSAAGPEVLDLLAWLGVEVAGPRAATEADGICYHDPSLAAPASVDGRELASAANLPGVSLEQLRQQGYLAEAIFSALIRSSYGPSSPEFYPTRSELGFYFDDALLLDGSARWDTEYLRDCQAFFTEELMPAELLAKSLESLPAKQRDRLTSLSRLWQEELHGVTFLVAEQLESLQPLALLLSCLLDPDKPAVELRSLLASVSVWDKESWSKAWQDLPEERRAELARQLCAEFADQADKILFTAGPRLLAWRSGAPSGARL